LAQTGTKFGGIINADIRLRHPAEIRKNFSDLRPNQLAYVKRLDIRSPDDEFGRIYSFGIDVFLFHVDAVAQLDLRDMTLGVPWWDYYVPLAALFGGLDLIEWPSEIAQHLWHIQKWEQSLWREYYKIFRERFEERLTTEIVSDRRRFSPLIL